MRAVHPLPLASTAAVHYPETDAMAESTLQRLIAEFLRPLLQRFLQQVWDQSVPSASEYTALRTQGPFFTGADQFWYFEKDNNRAQVSPDVYVIAEQRPTQTPSSWFMWKLNSPPLFAFEVVSEDFEKDYRDAPIQYASTGVRELVVFDPEAPKEKVVRRGQASLTRYRWQVWRRNDEGGFDQVIQSNEDRVKSESLHCWLRLVGEGEQRLIRIGLGHNGDDLFLSAVESAELRVEHERAEKEQERAEKEQERAARIKLEAQLAALSRDRVVRGTTEKSVSKAKRKG